MTGPRGVSICSECVVVAHEVVKASRIPPSGDRVLTGIGMLVTNDPRRPGPLGVVEGAAVAVRLGRVTWVGEEHRLPGRYRQLPEIRCGGRMVVPGFVDACTFLTGTAATGRPDPEVAAADTADRVSRSLQRGTTTIVIGAGGSGDPITDTSLLAVCRVVGERLPLRVEVAWRVASPGRMVRVTPGMVATAARLASTVLLGPEMPEEETHLIRRAGLRVGRAGLPAGSFRGGPAADLIVDPDGLDADDLDRLVKTQVPVVCTAAALLAGRPWPARELLDAGGVLALATGADPEGVEVAGLALAMSLATAFGGLTADEALWAVTRGGAVAVDAADLGWVGPGSAGDLVVLDASDPSELVARPDAGPAFRVVVGGDLIPV